MNDIGGWCCPNCRSLKRGSKSTNKTQNLTQKNAGNIDAIQTKLSVMNDQIAELSVGLNKILSIMPNAGVIASKPASNTSKPQFPASSAINNESYANALKSLNIASSQESDTKQMKSSGLEKKLQTAVLSAVHEEFYSIAQRSLNIVVTGLPINEKVPGDVQFSELCFATFHLNPHIKSITRFKKTNDGRGPTAFSYARNGR